MIAASAPWAHRLAGVLGTVVVLAALTACPRAGRVGATAPSDLPADVPGLLRYTDEALAEPPAFARALAAAMRGLELAPRDAGLAWRGARAAFELADAETDSATALRHAECGLQLAERGIAADEGCGPCHYYLALTLGIVARTRSTAGALEMVKRVATHGKRALVLVPAFASGGPGRLLGLLYARVPPWPTSFGDLEEAQRLLRAAVEAFPAFPLNRLFLAETLMLDKHYDQARRELKMVLSAPREGEWARIGARWRREAQKLQRRIILREKDEE